MFTPIVLLVAAGLLIVVGVLIGPETRGVELHAADFGQSGLTGGFAD